MTQVETLSNQGRLTVPPGFRDALDLGPGAEAVLVGSEIGVEIWNAARWEAELRLLQKHEAERAAAEMRADVVMAGGDSRRQSGLVRGGPGVVVTTKGVMRFRPDSKEMYLASFHPGLCAQDVAADTGFALDIGDAVETAPPAAEELRILREAVDPERIFLK